MIYNDIMMNYMFYTRLDKKTYEINTNKSFSLEQKRQHLINESSKF